ncbi:MAG TPA: response regulator [Vicinamibacteria bacterium]|nr:response regulator [Vicinamibacteria bacterium]
MAEPLRVLLVEDSADDALLLEREIRRGGFDLSLTRVENESQFLSAMSQAWDVVVSDYVLPRFTALGVLRHLRHLHFDIPTIVVSGTVTESELVDAMKAGAHDYVQKQNLARLVVAIRRELGEAAGRRRRREAENALREAQERFRFVVENTADVVYRLRFPDMVYDYLSPGIERLTGYGPREINGVGLNGLIVSVTDTAGRPVAIEKLEWARRIEQFGEFSADYQVRTKSGELRWLADHSFPWRDGHGRLLGAVGTLVDVTVRKDLEAQLTQAQKMEAVGRLAGGVAHDFNNLTTAILGYSELMLRRLGPDDPLRRHVAEVTRAAERAAALTRQLLAFSRKQLLQPKVLDVAEVLEHSRGLLERLIGEDVELVTRGEPGVGRVRADPVQLDQVILNLAVNARDAMPRGGRLVLEASNADLDEDYAHEHVTVRPGRYVMLAVSDTGHGMDKETQQRIFEPFFTTKEMGKGTGLGLSTVYGIVQQSGGYVWVYSEVGRGTTFKIYLPRVEDEADRPPPVAEPPAARAITSGLVLLVEDEASVRELLRELLETAGYSVLEASRPGEALRIAQARAEPIQLLITDVVMPEMTGPELARRLAEMRPGLRMLFLSGYTEGVVVDKGLLGEGAHFLQKPFTGEVLEAKVREVLDAAARAAP